MPKEKELTPEGIIEMMKAQFGNAVKAYWFYDGDLCPCCLTRPIDEMIFEGKKALSPKEPTPMHKDIENNLVTGYLRHVNSLT
jgi:hypothetical protein